MYKIEIIAAIVGLLYLWLEYKANVWLWIVGVIMPVLYIYIFFHSKFYADMAINVYYLLASLYGWWRWQTGSSKKENSDTELSISHTPPHYYWMLFAVFSACLIIISLILVRFTDSPVPYGDAFTTALSIVGMWMLANKYIEQWWVWAVVNIVSAALYYSKAMYSTAILYSIYTVVSFLGYFKWKKLMKA
jgi:nicotinamide mononucleotide transporter PnuC